MQAKSIQFLSGRFTLVLLYLYALNPLKTRNPQTGTLANSEDPDKMLHNATFTQSALIAKTKINLQRQKYIVFYRNYNL